MKQTTLSELARSLAVSLAAIRKAIRTERIPAHLVGQKELATGRVVPVIIDFDAARAAFLGTASPTGTPLPPSGIKGDIPPIAESRALHEAFKARITQLEYEQRSGKLVDAEEFRTKFTTMVVTARTRLLGVPSKAKGRIPHLTVDDIGVLTDLIREALEGIANATIEEE